MCKTVGSKFAMISRKSRVIVGLLFTIAVSFGYSRESLLTSTHSERSTYASLAPVHEATLSSPMTGMIERINFRPGDAFRQNQVLIQFNCKEINLKADRAGAELKAAASVLASTQDLIKLNSASQVELAQAQSQYDIAKAEFEINKYHQSQCQLNAPYDGEVVNQEAKANETVKIDDPVIEIVNNRDLEVKMYIPSNWLAEIKVGTKFTLTLVEIKNKTFEGVISKIVRRIDPASQSVLVYGKLLLKDTQDLFAGMSGIADFDTVSISQSTVTTQ